MMSSTRVASVASTRSRLFGKVMVMPPVRSDAPNTPFIRVNFHAPPSFVRVDVMR